MSVPEFAVSPRQPEAYIAIASISAKRPQNASARGLEVKRTRINIMMPRMAEHNAHSGRRLLPSPGLPSSGGTTPDFMTVVGVVVIDKAVEAEPPSITRDAGEKEQLDIAGRPEQANETAGKDGTTPLAVSAAVIVYCAVWPALMRTGPVLELTL